MTVLSSHPILASPTPSPQTASTSRPTTAQYQTVRPSTSILPQLTPTLPLTPTLATTPSCPKAILQFQHGTYTLPPNGSLLLTPFSVDGRQQLSDPCASSHSQYTRYSQFELFQQYDTTIDAYKKVRRLTLYQFDGVPLQPLYLAYSPPLMLPTVTMNPTPVATVTGAAATARVRARRAEEGEGPMNRGARHIKRHDGTGEKKGLDVEDLVWWVGLGMTVLGGAVYLS